MAITGIPRRLQKRHRIANLTPAEAEALDRANKRLADRMEAEQQEAALLFPTEQNSPAGWVRE